MKTKISVFASKKLNIKCDGGGAEKNSTAASLVSRRLRLHGNSTVSRRNSTASGFGRSLCDKTPCP